MRSLATLLALLALTTPARAQDLDGVIARIAGAWGRGDTGAITTFAAHGGLSLDLGRGAIGPVASRQAAAVLKRAFEERETVSVRPRMTRVVAGNPTRAFGELTWIARVRGTTIPTRVTVFLALVREGDAWRITEIRIMS